LKARAPGAVTQTEQEIEELKSTIGDLYVENAIPGKANALWGSLTSEARFEETESRPCTSSYSKTGFGRAIRTICSVLGYNRSIICYSPKPESKKDAPLDTQLIEAIRDIIERFP